MFKFSLSILIIVSLAFSIGQAENKSNNLQTYKNSYSNIKNNHKTQAPTELERIKTRNSRLKLENVRLKKKIKSLQAKIRGINKQLALKNELKLENRSLAQSHIITTSSDIYTVEQKMLEKPVEIIQQNLATGASEDIKTTRLNTFYIE